MMSKETQTTQFAIAERLIAAGNSNESVNAAIALITSGAMDLVQRVIDRELDPELAWQIARTRRRRR